MKLRETGAWACCAQDPPSASGQCLAPSATSPITADLGGEESSRAASKSGNCLNGNFPKSGELGEKSK